ncbi:MAG: CinA family protein [Gammaproteobacteria bacterium]
MKQLSERGSIVADTLKTTNQTVAVAESSTGGLISASLLAVPGASAYYYGGTVIYTIEARRELLGIPDAVLKGQTPLSESYVALCAKHVREKMNATWGIAELGATGPAGTRYGHEPGICVLAVDGPVSLTARIENGSPDREGNMEIFADAAIELLRQAMDQNTA